MLSKLHLDSIAFIQDDYPFLRIITEYKLPKSPLRFDIYLPDISLAIEIQGIQHYEQNNFFHSSALSFIDANVRDREKRNLAHSNGIEILYIKYNAKNFKYLIAKKIEEKVTAMDDDDIILSFEEKYTASQIEYLCCPICKNRFQWKDEVDNILGHVKYDICCGIKFVLFKNKPNGKKYRAMKEKLR